VSSWPRAFAKRLKPDKDNPDFSAMTRISVAPMMDRTDRHFRFLIRILSRRAWLYTEMITAPALLHGDAKKLLRFHPAEHPIALQLGGSDPGDLARCAKMARDAGYDEINLNVGCPSERVQSGSFGVCLMGEPERVAECMQAMAHASGLPVSVKHRIGFDDRDSYEELTQFVATVAKRGCKNFIVHARKAWLKGLSPKENREKPPLRYDIVARLKRDFSDLEIEINGGIKTWEETEDHLRTFDGVMIGRQAYDHPFQFAELDSRFFGEADSIQSREDAVLALVPYVRSELEQGERFSAIVRHFTGLFAGVRGAKAWRQTLCGEASRNCGVEDGIDILEKALHEVAREVARASNVSEISEQEQVT
jgi:tRNA-dihydrouridine synthase A